MRSFKSNENIHKKEGGSYYVVSANKASSVTLQSSGNESQRNCTKRDWLQPERLTTANFSGVQIFTVSMKKQKAKSSIFESHKFVIYIKPFDYTVCIQNGAWHHTMKIYYYPILQHRFQNTGTSLVSWRRGAQLVVHSADNGPVGRSQNYNVGLQQRNMVAVLKKENIYLLLCWYSRLAVSGQHGSAKRKTHKKS